MLLREGELALFMLRSPNLPIPAVFSVPSVLIYDTREAPCSSLGGLSGRSLRRTLRVQVVA